VEVLLPAQATYLGFDEDEVMMSQTTSNGLAAGQSLEDATLRALYELIERDAFMLHWLSRRKGQRLDVTDCDGVCRTALSEIEKLGAHTELYLLDLGCDYPTIVCLGLGDGIAWPGATIGLGTHADIDTALRKAVLEHSHYGTYMRRLLREGQRRNVCEPTDVEGSRDHGLYFCHPANTVALDCLREEQPSIGLRDLRNRYTSPGDLQACVASLAACGIRVASVDLTTRDLASAGCNVVRVFGIHAQPIHFGFGYERRNSPRLKSLLSGVVQTSPHPMA